MIKKTVTVTLTKEEVENTEPIQIVLDVKEVGSTDGITYTIDYPKET